MGRITWTFAIVLGGTLALVASPADAQSRKKQSSARGTTVHVPSGYQSFSRSYNYAAPRGGGINFSDGRMGANYNPNGG